MIRIQSKSVGYQRAAVGIISPLLLVLLALSLAGTPLKADTIRTYHLSGTLDDGISFAGTLDYDTSSGKISAINVTTNGARLPARGTWIKTDLEHGNAAGFTADNGSSLITISFLRQLTGTWTDYFGGAFGGAVIASDTSGSSEVSKRGSVTAVPEPSTLPIALLGMLALIGVTPWRRVLQRARSNGSAPDIRQN